MRKNNEEVALATTFDDILPKLEDFLKGNDWKPEDNALFRRGLLVLFTSSRHFSSFIGYENWIRNRLKKYQRYHGKGKKMYHNLFYAMLLVCFFFFYFFYTCFYDRPQNHLWKVEELVYLKKPH